MLPFLKCEFNFAILRNLRLVQSWNDTPMYLLINVMHKYLGCIMEDFSPDGTAEEVSSRVIGTFTMLLLLALSPLLQYTHITSNNYWKWKGERKEVMWTCKYWYGLVSAIYNSLHLVVDWEHWMIYGNIRFCNKRLHFE